MIGHCFAVQSPSCPISGEGSQGPGREQGDELGDREPEGQMPREGGRAGGVQGVVRHLLGKADKDGAQVQEAQGRGRGELHGDDLLIGVPLKRDCDSVSVSVSVVCL